MKIILTGATGMVGEGVLLECLKHPDVEKVLMVNRKPFALQHPKLEECVVPGFLDLSAVSDRLAGYDACFYCAGISSAGMKEAEYSHITYDITIDFAEVLQGLNPDMVFDYVSGALTNSSEQGRVMWARVKGKTENALMKMAFRKVYCFRPGAMKPVEGQRNVKGYYQLIGPLYPLLNALFPKHVSTLSEVGLAMICSATKGYPKQVLEIVDIKALAKS